MPAGTLVAPLAGTPRGWVAEPPGARLQGQGARPSSGLRWSPSCAAHFGQTTKMLRLRLPFCRLNTEEWSE